MNTQVNDPLPELFPLPQCKTGQATIPTGTILVVDDNQIDIFLLARAISPVITGCRFLTAGDGFEAEELLQKMAEGRSLALPAVIFTDINMPRYSGFEFLQWIKRQPNFARIPVVMISDFSNPAHLEKSFALGAVACLPKPPDPAEAQRLTARLLRGIPEPRGPESPHGWTHRTWSQRQAAKKILLADDDPGVRETLGRVLESEHYEVVFAKNGNEAAAKSVSSQPDMVLLDLNMPERDGWSAFRFMNAAHPLVPVIVITARPNQYSQAEQLGVDALMEKPLNLKVLLEAIDLLLSETESERARRVTDSGFHTAFLSHRAGK